MNALMINPAIQLIALFAVAAIVLGVMVYVSVRTFLMLKNKGKTLDELAEDGNRLKDQLERCAGILSDKQEDCI